MELRQLRHFVTLAQARNFSRAAEQLHIAQPALSISIRNLETEIGTRLFDRGPRHVTLTEAGRLALRSARAALESVAEVGELAAAVSTGEAGTLKLAFVGGATFDVLPRHLPEFRRRHPGVELDLIEGTTVEVIERVRSGAVDAGFVRHPVLSPTGLASIVVERDLLVAALPRGHRLAGKARLKMRDLADEDFIQYAHAHAPSMHMVVVRACEAAGFKPRLAQEAVQIQTIVSLVESGLGVALVPGLCQRALGQNVDFRPITDHRAEREVGLALVYDASVRKPLLENFMGVLGARPARR